MTYSLVSESKDEIVLRMHSRKILALGGFAIMCMLCLFGSSYAYIIFQDIEIGIDWITYFVGCPSTLVLLAAMMSLIWHLARRSIRISFDRTNSQLDMLEQSLTVTGQLKEEFLVQIPLPAPPNVKCRQIKRIWETVIDLPSKQNKNYLVYRGKDQFLANHLAERLNTFFRESAN